MDFECSARTMDTLPDRHKSYTVHVQCVLSKLTLKYMGRIRASLVSRGHMPLLPREAMSLGAFRATPSCTCESILQHVRPAIPSTSIVMRGTDFGIYYKECGEICVVAHGILKSYAEMTSEVLVSSGMSQWHVGEKCSLPLAMHGDDASDTFVFPVNDIPHILKFDEIRVSIFRAFDLVFAKNFILGKTDAP